MKKLISFTVILALLPALFCSCVPNDSSSEQSLDIDFSGGHLNKVTASSYSSDTVVSSGNVLPQSDEANKSEEENKPFTPIKHRDRGDAVSAIQKRLIELKYMNAEVTGYFGTATQDAVTRFQTDNGLEPTGIVDEPTYKCLFSDNVSACTLPLAGLLIGIDPGHQRHSNSDQEPVAPGSSETKKKVSSGTEGRWTHTAEYEINLRVGLLLRDLLCEQGATVIMTHETADVNISNIERAEFFNKNKTDYAIRLHCNGTDDSNVNGAFMLVPPKSHPFFSEAECAAQALLDEYCKETGLKNLGLTYRSDQTGFNWCERMIINIEMGHLSNKDEDYKLSDSEFQKKMAKGLLNGILAYYSGR